MATTIDRRFLSFGVMGITGDLTGIDPLFINETGDLTGDFHLQSSGRQTVAKNKRGETNAEHTNRRSQRKLFNRWSFRAYLKHYLRVSKGCAFLFRMVWPVVPLGDSTPTA